MDLGPSPAAAGHSPKGCHRLQKAMQGNRHPMENPGVWGALARFQLRPRFEEAVGLGLRLISTTTVIVIKLCCTNSSQATIHGSYIPFPTPLVRIMRGDGHEPTGAKPSRGKSMDGGNWGSDLVHSTLRGESRRFVQKATTPDRNIIITAPGERGQR